jgi:hypothetical protein
MDLAEEQCPGTGHEQRPDTGHEQRADTGHQQRADTGHQQRPEAATAPRTPGADLRQDRRALARRRVDQRQAIAEEVAAPQSGVATRRMLVAAGITRDAIRAQITAGRWQAWGVHTVEVARGGDPLVRQQWRAVWEAGSGAVLDGVSSLQAAGLAGWTERMVHVSVPGRCRAHRVDGVRVHRLRELGPTLRAGVTRTAPEVAVIRAAEWAASDRQAATVLAMTMQQRLARPDRVLDVWRSVRRSRRRALLEQVVRDVCDGAHSLGELDFAALCRARGLPEPTRQAVLHGPRGRIYLDVWWEDLGVHVEIDGAQHYGGLAPVDDALRHNALVVDGALTLRIPVLGLRVLPDAFMDQVVAAHEAVRCRRRAAG